MSVERCTGDTEVYLQQIRVTRVTLQLLYIYIYILKILHIEMVQKKSAEYGAVTIILSLIQGSHDNVR